MRIETVFGHTFISDLISKDGLVIDCGANDGQFAKWISANIGCKIEGFEPDPSLYPKLFNIKGGIFYNEAIAAIDGTATLALGNKFCSTIRYRESEMQQTLQVKQRGFASYVKENKINEIELLKLDIEGAEIDLLTNTDPETLLKCKQITVEFHDFLYRKDIPLIKKTLTRLRSIGFWVVCFSFHTFGNVLFVNKKSAPITSIQKMHILVKTKYGSALKRFLRIK
jgi:FkbM family methyltransferase